MSTIVEVPVGRVTRISWVFPALAAAAALPWVPWWLGNSGRLDNLPAGSDGLFWGFIGLCVAAPLALPIVAAAGWRVLARGARIALVCATVLGVAAAAQMSVAELAYAGGVTISAVEFMRTGPLARRAMRLPPPDAARAAVAAGNYRFLAVRGLFGNHVPGVSSRCVKARWGVQVMPVGFELTGTPAMLRLRDAESAYAERYNAALAEALHLAPGALDAYDACPARGDAAEWLPFDEVPAR
ncbi:MAG TPA: hypothetical protein VF092_12630 [Longimicrobium sp.]